MKLSEHFNMADNKPTFKRLKVFPPIAGGGDVVCFNFSGDSLKLAHGRVTAAGPQLVNFLSIDVQGISDDDISKSVKEAFVRWNLKSFEVINVMPANVAITKDIEIPSQDDQEIREILDLQAIRHTPYAQEEIIIDYLRVGTRKESYTKVIFMIVPLSQVRRNIAVLARAGANIERIFFAPEALSLAGSQIFHLEQKDSLQTIIHVDVKFTDFLNVARGKLVYLRSIPIGTQHLTAEKDRYYPRFVEEIKKSVEAYEGEEGGRKSEEYILTGAPVETESLLESLQQALNQRVKVAAYWEQIPLASDQLKSVLSTAKESFLDVAAVAMMADHLKINFIPEEVKLRKLFEQRSQDLVKLGFSIMMILALVCSVFIMQIYFKSAYLKNLTGKYQDDLQKSKKLKDDYARMQLVKDFSKDNNIPLDVLAELYRLIPIDVRFTAIKYSDQGKIAVEGNAKTMATVFSLLTNLEESSYFKKAESKRTAKRKEGDEELVDFEIVCMLEGLSGEGKK